MVWAAACGLITSTLILSSCGEPGPPSAVVANVPSTSTTDLTSKALPEDAARTQLRWLLSSVADTLLSAQEIDSHFDAAFLAKFSTAEINTVLARLPVPGTLVGVLSSGPAGLVAIANFGTTRRKVTPSVDPSGLIQELLLTPSASAGR